MDVPLRITVESPERIVLAISGVLDKAHVEDLRSAIAGAERAIRGAYEKAGKRIRILLDLSEFTGVYDIEAMKLMASFAKHNADCVEKTAGFGGPDIGIMAGRMIAALANRDNIRFFATKEEALAWLG